jgi:hypothetical protein
MSEVIEELTTNEHELDLSASNADPILREMQKNDEQPNLSTPSNDDPNVTDNQIYSMDFSTELSTFADIPNERIESNRTWWPNHTSLYIVRLFPSQLSKRIRTVRLLRLI